MRTYNRANYDVMLGNDSIELFDVLQSDVIHGLTRTECSAYLSNATDVYIAGMANVWNDRPFIFINIRRFHNSLLSEGMGIVCHEAVHLQILLMGHPTDETEEVWACGVEAIVCDVVACIMDNLWHS